MIKKWNLIRKDNEKNWWQYWWNKDDQKNFNNFKIMFKKFSMNSGEYNQNKIQNKSFES